MKRLFVGLFVLVSLSMSAQQYQSIDLLEYNLTQDSIRFYMLEYLNEFRVKNHKQSLTYDSALNVGALNHSLYLACHNEFTHIATKTNSPYFTGRRPTQRCGMPASENIASRWQYVSLNATPKQIAKSLIEQWEQSPGHRANMLADHRYFGFGLSLRKHGGSHLKLDVYAVQTFSGRLEFK